MVWATPEGGAVWDRRSVAVSVIYGSPWTQLSKPMLCVRENALFWWKNLARARSALPNHGKWWNHTLFFTKNEADLRKIVKFWWNIDTFLARKLQSAQKSISKGNLRLQKVWNSWKSQNMLLFCTQKCVKSMIPYDFLWKTNRRHADFENLTQNFFAFQLLIWKNKMKRFRHELEREQVQT